uniref:hypothetical protein n=1 Tax=Agathobacter sp. TaxID=2021311 RepID=UPI0040572886
MSDTKIKKYNILNTLAKKNGIVIFGGNEDLNIPIGELKQAFAIESNIYNRSIEGLSIHNAIHVYDEYIAPLAPETILIHIGNADLKNFEKDTSTFDQKFRELIAHIRLLHPKCRIAIISLKNYSSNWKISEMNTHLKYIAESEHCEYGDISNKHVWNPKSTMDAVSFVYSTGFIHALKNKRPIYDLVKMFFSYEV